MLCSCGSGRIFKRCHGDPANDFARRQALREARQVALLFPSVRTSSPSALAAAEEVARRLEGDETSDEQLDELAGHVDEAERRRLIDGWRLTYPDRWASLSHTAGSVEAAELELVKGALAVAVHERLPTPHELLVELELTEPRPAVADAFVLPPPFLWSYDEARVAAVPPMERTTRLPCPWAGWRRRAAPPPRLFRAARAAARELRERHRLPARRPGACADRIRTTTWLGLHHFAELT